MTENPIKAVSERFRQFENTKPRAQKLGTKKIFTLVSLKKIIAILIAERLSCLHAILHTNYSYWHAKLQNDCSSVRPPKSAKRKIMRFQNFQPIQNRLKTRKVRKDWKFDLRQENFESAGRLGKSWVHFSWEFCKRKIMILWSTSNHSHELSFWSWVYRFFLVSRFS